MTEPCAIILPWPPRELSPNARAHWAQKARAAKTYRRTCYWLTRHSEPDKPAQDGPIPVRITFHPRDKKARDEDNMLASLKAGLDGVADALGVSDSRFEITVRRGAVTSTAHVEVRL